MAARKKKKGQEAFSPEDVTKSLNREVAHSAGGKKMSLEEATLRKLVVEAVKEKKYSAVKQLLETFDECGAIGSPKTQGGVIIFPKDLDYKHYYDSLIWEGTKSRLPESYKPKLSKIGLKKVEAGKAQHEELLAQSQDAHDTVARALRELAEIPNPFAGLKKPGMSWEDVDKAFDKWDPEKKEAWLDSVRRMSVLRRMIFDEIESLQEALDKHNRKWGGAFSIPWLEKLPPPFRYPSGFKKPPKHRQFRKGQSGNPAGRPPAKKSRDDLAKSIAFEEIPVKEGGVEKTKRIIEVIFDVLGFLALTGDSRARTLRRKHLKKFDPKRNPKVGYLLAPEQLTVEEYLENIEDLDEHRKICEEAIATMKEDDEKLRLPSHSVQLSKKSWRSRKAL